MAANRKQDLRIRNLGVQKQNRIPFLTGTPGPSVGRDGDMQIRLVPRKGLYLFYKHGNEWYGTKMEKFIKKLGMAIKLSYPMLQLDKDIII